MSKAPLTKGEKLRLASKLTWIISAVLTTNFVRAVVGTESIFMFPVIFACCCGVQYAITLAESALFEGHIPPPWRIDWADAGPVPWIWSGALLCLILDVLLNLGGVSFFLLKINDSSTGVVLRSQFGADDAFISTLMILLTVAFSVLAAVGSELLDAYADIVEGVPPRTKGNGGGGSALVTGIMDRLREHGSVSKEADEPEWRKVADRASERSKNHSRTRTHRIK